MRRVFLIGLGAFSAAALIVSSAASTTFTVRVGPPSAPLGYSPNPQTINVGDTVHWVWDSSPHSTTSGPCPPCTGDGQWDSGVLSTPATFNHTFTVAGTYPYFCTFHDQSMKGTIIVNPPTGVRFTSFTAARTAREIRVSWRTGSELKTLGFDVYRERGDRRVRLTRPPIAARGETRGASYSFLDRTAPRRGERVAYWLRVVETDGSRSWFGRASVSG